MASWRNHRVTLRSASATSSSLMESSRHTTADTAPSCAAERSFRDSSISIEGV
jgi:hypothetical protein